MKVKVIRQSKWEFPGEFPTFTAETPVVLGEEDTEFLGWHPCTIFGHETYVPKAFVSDGKLTRDYNPTELQPKIGDILEVQEIVNAWLLAKNNAVVGWIPAECVVSYFS